MLRTAPFHTHAAAQTALSVSAHQFRADASAPSCDGAVWRALSTLLRVAPEAAWDAAKRGAAACVGAERMRGGETQVRVACAARWCSYGA